MTDKGVVESATKNYRTRVVVLPQLIYDYLGELLFNQIVENNGVQPGDLIFAKQGKPIHRTPSAVTCGNYMTATVSQKTTTCTRCGIQMPVY